MANREVKVGGCAGTNQREVRVEASLALVGRAAPNKTAMRTQAASCEPGRVKQATWELGAVSSGVERRRLQGGDRRTDLSRADTLSLVQVEFLTLIPGSKELGRARLV